MTKAFLTILSITLYFNVFSQFQINGDAFQSSDSCYVITGDLQGQSGNIWTTEKIDLNQAFDFRFRMYFGDKDGNGADGFVFALQPVSNTIGGTGGGLGFLGISPSFGVEFDTYQNQSPYNDPPGDHMAILKNGDVNHFSTNNLAGPVDISPNSPDVEDNQFYWVRFKWDPSTTLFEVYYDCESRLTYQGDIINSIFGGDPLVYWGVTGGTGLYHNRQEVCLVDLGTEEFEMKDESLCNNDSIQLNAISSGVFTYNWSPNYNITSKSISNPKVFPESTTTYSVTVKDECDNIIKDTVTIFVPNPIDSINDTTICSGSDITLNVNEWSTASYSWNNTPGEPSIIIEDSGSYILEVKEFSCTYLDTILVAIVNCSVPNIFTPNGDSYNETFDLSNITGTDENWNFSVFNRWGRLVYEKIGYNNDWNGGELNDGVYYYSISKQGGEPTKGWFQIVR